MYDFTIHLSFFRAKFILFLVHTVIMTTALVLAARKQDPCLYNEDLDIFRGICEAVLFLCVMYNIFREVFKLRRYEHSMSSYQIKIAFNLCNI